MVVGPILEHTDYQDMEVQVRAVEVAAGKPVVIHILLLPIAGGTRYRTYVKKTFLIRIYKSLKTRSITVKRRSKLLCPKCPLQYDVKERLKSK